VIESLRAPTPEVGLIVVAPETVGTSLCTAGVEKIFCFLGPQENIENFLQIIKYLDTWTETV
jgi:hypothetical protein